MTKTVSAQGASMPKSPHVSAYKGLVDKKTGLFIGWIIPQPDQEITSHMVIDVPADFSPVTHVYDLKTKTAVVSELAVLESSIAAIDGIHRGAHGQGVINIAHARKALEARAYIDTGGKVVGPLIAAEAETGGVSLAVFVGEIVALDDAFISHEIERRILKRGMQERLALLRSDAQAAVAENKAEEA